MIEILLNDIFLSVLLLAFYGTVAFTVGVFVGRSSSYILKREKELVEHVAYHDYLTGMRNRASYELHMKRLVLKQKSIGIIMLDVNGLKNYNDLKGHDAGDKFLQDSAKLIRLAFRGEECRFYRVGGDEFVVTVLQNTQKVCAEARGRVNKCCDDWNLEHPNEIITIASGYAIWTPGMFMDRVEKEADKWMYRYKEIMKEDGVQGIR